MLSNTFIALFNASVDKPKIQVFEGENVFVTKIESPEITKTYRALFEFVWEMLE